MPDSSPYVDPRIRRARRRAAAAAALSALLAAPIKVRAEVKNADTFVYAASNDPDSYDPDWAHDIYSFAVIENVYEPLLRYNASSTGLEPLLATKVPSRSNGLISADGRTYRFPIRKGVRFHDGSEMTADDARYSLLRFMLTDRPGGASDRLLRPLLGLMTTRPDGRLLDDVYDRAAAAVTVEGGDVVVRLPRPFAPFLTEISDAAMILSRSWCAAHGQWDGRRETWRRFNGLAREAAIPNGLDGGSGPFRIERFDPVQRQTVLARHDAYWRGPAKLARVDIKTVPEFVTRKLMLAAGDADAISAPLSQEPGLRSLPGVRVIDGLRPLMSQTFMIFTQKMNPAGNPNIGSGRLDGEGVPPDFFADADARAAFAAAFDYDGYIRDVLRGAGSRYAGVIPPGVLGHLDAAPPARFDLARAAAAFRRAWGGRVWSGGFKLALGINAGSETSRMVGQILKRDIESLNPKFRVDLRELPWSSLVDQQRRRQLPIAFQNWSDAPDPNGYAQAFLHSSGFFASLHGYGDPALDRLIEEAAATGDVARRAALYDRIQRRGDELAPFAPISTNVRFRAERSWVKGFVFRSDFPDMPASSYYYDLSKSE